MVLANKCVVALQPEYGAWMLLMQVAFTAIVMVSFALLHTSSAFNYSQLKAWTPCALLFTCNIVTSAMALEYIHVPTFSVLRNVQPFISTIVGLYVLPLLNPNVDRETTSYFKLYALLLIFVGTAIYAWKDVAFDVSGYLWVFGHITSMSLYIAVVKSKGIGANALPSSTMSL
jgi:drug/metabolite transporter (DMT)-like permease